MVGLLVVCRHLVGRGVVERMVCVIVSSSSLRTYFVWQSEIIRQVYGSKIVFAIVIGK